MNTMVKKPKLIRVSSTPVKEISLSVVIPAYNEDRTIENVLNKILAFSLQEKVVKEVIVVNDCSTDNTESVVDNFIATNPGLKINHVKHLKNQGKGAAIRSGVALATGSYLIIQDADLEYDPREYSKLLDPVLNAGADVVYGSRFRGGSVHRVLFFWHSIGNKFLTFVSNMTTNLNLTDMETGYKLFRTEIIQQINIVESRFGFEPEITAKISKVKDIKIYEVGISYYGRSYAEGKKINWKDGLRALYCILKYSIV